MSAIYPVARTESIQVIPLGAISNIDRLASVMLKCTFLWIDLSAVLLIMNPAWSSHVFSSVVHRPKSRCTERTYTYLVFSFRAVRSGYNTILPLGKASYQSQEFTCFNTALTTFS